MILTSYISNIRHLPADCKKIFICRWLPRGINMNSDDLFHLPELSPSEWLLKELKGGKLEWEEFKMIFMGELATSDLAQDRIEFLSKTQEVAVLLCYEKDATTCHRSIVGELIKDAGGEVREFTKEEAD